MPWWYWAMAAVISALIGAVTIQAAAKAAGDAKLRLAQAEVERLAKLAERERIARDLHDVLGHTLSVVVLKSELAQKLIARDPARAAAEMGDVERIARDGLAEVRQAITGYRSSGLAAEIEHVRETLVAAGIDATDRNAGDAARAGAGNGAVARAAGSDDQRDPARRRHAVPRPFLRPGRLGAAGGRRQRPRRRRAVRQRPDRHARAHPGARRRPAPRDRPRHAAPDQAADMSIRVLIAEDQGMVLGALAALLEIEADIEVVARARDGREALALAATSDPDVVLTDIEMPQMTGLEMAAELHRTRKGGRPRVIILTTFARPGYLRRALDAGASGYLLKDAPAEKLADAIRGVHQGLRVVDPQLAQDAWGEADPLTDRERQVLRAAEEGLASAEIARRLSLSEGTVRNYLSEAIAKLGVGNRIEAARLARQRGWL